MNPYYADEWVTLYLADCLDLTEWLAADVLITDPPYGMAFVSGQTKTRRPIENDETTDARDAVRDAWGDTKPWAMFGTWKQPRPRGTEQVLVWDKTDGTGPGMGDLNNAFGTSHEEVYLGGPWERRGKRRGSVIRTPYSLSGLATQTGHPTPKPVDLMEVLIWAAAPGIVADPFAGTGATLLAAKAQHRHAVGVEIVERYAEIAARRLAQNVLDYA